jgi:phosphatidylethanolamine/phosphatidyl-N-methylethanolamine N-methyltransferase
MHVSPRPHPAETLRVKALDMLPFFRAWMSNPLRVAAIAPSGPALAALITREITPQTGPVLELGPGTGAFTRALLARGVAPHDLTLVEFGADFTHLLRHRFPQARVIQADAARLARIGLYEGAPVGAVISGLPMLSMPVRQVMAVLAGSFSYVRDGGAFYQFTYGPRCPVRHAVLERLGLKATRVGGAWLNVPPASVYRITRVRAPGIAPRG